jgi:hypothetical protein
MNEDDIKFAQQRALEGFIAWAKTLSTDDMRVLLSTLRMMQDAHTPDVLKA